MDTKFVIRLLGVEGELLGWTQTYAHARGDGALWATEPIAIPIECAGQPNMISIHWADVNVEIRHTFRERPVKVGDVVAPEWEGPILRVGPPAGGLPAVTVRQSITVGIPVGALGVVGSR